MSFVLKSWRRSLYIMAGSTFVDGFSWYSCVLLKPRRVFGSRKSEVGSGRSNCEQPSSVFVVYSHPLLSGKVDFFLRGGLGGCTHASKNGHNCRLICRLRRIKLSTSKACFSMWSSGSPQSFQKISGRYKRLVRLAVSIYDRLDRLKGKWLGIVATSLGETI